MPLNLSEDRLQIIHFNKRIKSRKILCFISLILFLFLTYYLLVLEILGEFSFVYFIISAFILVLLSGVTWRIRPPVGYSVAFYFNPTSSMFTSKKAESTSKKTLFLSIIIATVAYGMHFITLATAIYSVLGLLIFMFLLIASPLFIQFYVTFLAKVYLLEEQSAILFDDLGRQIGEIGQSLQVWSLEKRKIRAMVDRAWNYTQEKRYNEYPETHILHVTLRNSKQTFDVVFSTKLEKEIKKLKSGSGKPDPQQS